MKGNKLLSAEAMDAIQRTLEADGKHYETEDIRAAVEEMDDYWPEELEEDF